MPIQRRPVAAIEGDLVKSGISLEALGLLAHILVQPNDEIDVAALQAIHQDYDVGSLVAELIKAGALGGKELEPALERRASPPPRATVYVAQTGNTFKIGVTKSLRKRLKHFKSANPGPVHLIWSRTFNNPVQIEMKLHRKLERYRLSGEWFRCPRDILDHAILEIEDAL